MKLFLKQWARGLRQPRQIVQGHVVELSQGDHVMQGDLLHALFIAGVLLLLHAKQLGDLCLRSFRVLAEILDPLVNVHKNSPFGMLKKTSFLFVYPIITYNQSIVLTLQHICCIIRVRNRKLRCRQTKKEPSEWDLISFGGLPAYIGYPVTSAMDWSIAADLRRMLPVRLTARSIFA